MPSAKAVLSVLACAVALLAATTPRAVAGDYRGVPDAPAYGPPARYRPGPPLPYARAPYGPPIVSGYLPRNNAVPMYNEPPRR